MTFGWAYEWAEVISENAGRAKGTGELIECRKCHGFTRFGDHPARHTQKRRGDLLVSFDCVGNVTGEVPCRS